MTGAQSTEALWFEDALNRAMRDQAFRRASRSLTASIHISRGDDRATVDFVDGDLFCVQTGRSDDTTIDIEGSDEQWQRALELAPDFASAAGILSIRGHYLHLAGGASALNLLWSSLRRSTGVQRPRPVSVLEWNARNDEGIIGRYTEVSGYRTYYEAVGQGRPVVCIHTGGADGREYRHLLPALAQSGFHAIAVDMPGHGKTYPNLDDRHLLVTASEWIDFVLQFSETLGLDRPVYVGCAMSASVLLQLAAEHPGSTSGIVSANGNASNYGGIGNDFLDLLNHPHINVADFMESSTLGLMGRNHPAHVQNECLWHNARNLSPEVMHADLLIYDGHDVRDQLRNITVPVLHVQGEFDTTVSQENRDLLRSGIENVTMTSIPGAGHFPMLEQPQIFNELVVGFARRASV